MSRKSIRVKYGEFHSTFITWYTHDISGVPDHRYIYDIYSYIHMHALHV